ncbi:Ig-like domain-containing protein [Bacillota bacterium Lsc_1132]
MKPKFLTKMLVSVLGLSVFLIIGISFPIKMKAQGNETQQVLVVYKNNQGKETVINKSQKVEKQFQSVPAISVKLTQQAITELNKNPNVAYMEPNVKFKISDNQLKPYKIRSNLDTTASTIPSEESQWDLQASNSPTAWQEGITGKGVKVAILDTGIATHPDLTIEGGISMVSYTNSYSDDNGHGTHIAGIVGAKHNGIGMVGVSPDAQLYAVKVLDNLGEGNLSDILSGLDWAISNHMNIINLSLGTDVDSQLFHDMVDKAYNNGIFVVSASGNSGNAQGTGDNVSYPAKYSHALSISAVDINMVRASFSSTGSKIDFSAGGVNVVSTYLNNNYAIGSGTSQAAPHVTGLLALLKQKYPTKTNDELFAILKSYAKDLGTAGKDTWYGYGFAQFQATNLPSNTNVTPPATGTSLPPKGYIDTPSNGATINGNSTIHGWFLDMSGVSKIEVLVDGKAAGVAQYGSYRPDVQKAFPDYQNANAGYQFTLNTRTISNGTHSLTIRETGNNGNSTVLSSIKVNISNLPKIGNIDTPVNGSTITGNSIVKGWFLDQTGVSKVDVLVDGKNIGTAEYGLSRPDVQKVFPDYQNANSGFQYTLNTKNISDGQHTLIVQETGIDGTTTVLNSIKINVLNFPTKGYIDTPTEGATINGDVNVNGWFLDMSGVSKVEVLVDGKATGVAQYGSYRPDVQKIFPDYQNANAGYQFTLNTRTLSNGSHSLTIRETGNNGNSTVLSSIKVNISNLPKIGTIDTPANGSTITGNSIVKGWFLDHTGVSKVDVLVDGKNIGTAEYGLSRPDVQKVFPDYQNANSGFQYTLNTKNISDGQHTLTVQETGIDGTTTVLNSIKINVLNFPTKGYIDTPTEGATINGDVNVNGWFLDVSGVSKVEVLVDGKSIGEAKYGSYRPDVQKIFPDYQNANAGYQFMLNTRTLSNGSHSLTIRETGNNGISTVLSSIKVNISNLPKIGTIDTPINNSMITGNSVVKGWFLDQSGVSKVDVLVDGKNIGTAEYGLSRPDVQKVFPDYQNANSGYQYTLNTKNLSDGQHTLTIQETGADGTITALSNIIITVQNFIAKGTSETPAAGVYSLN